MVYDEIIMQSHSQFGLWMRRS